MENIPAFTHRRLKIYIITAKPYDPFPRQSGLTSNRYTGIIGTDLNFYPAKYYQLDIIC